jgi:hypothetical protein
MIAPSRRRVIFFWLRAQNSGSPPARALPRLRVTAVSRPSKSEPAGLFRAKSRIMHRSKTASSFDHLVNADEEYRTTFLI